MYHDLEAAVAALKPSILIGVAAQPGAFSPRVLRLIAQNHERPFIFPLSNPTALAECTAAAAYQATAGRCVFASGSPFPPVELPGGRKVCVCVCGGGVSALLAWVSAVERGSVCVCVLLCCGLEYYRKAPLLAMMCP